MSSSWTTGSKPRREIHRDWQDAALSSWRWLVAIITVGTLLGAGISFIPVALAIRAFDVGFLTALTLTALAWTIHVKSGAHARKPSGEEIIDTTGLRTGPAITARELVT